MDSLRVWQAFAATYPDENDASLKRKQYNVREPDMGFNDYVTPLTSSSFQWLTFLTLTNITCLRNDLIGLSRMSNLGALTIGKGVLTPDVGLEDSVIKAWGHAASEAGAFSMLRVLILRQQKHVTSRIFSYLDSFPCLALLSLEDCSIGIKDNGVSLGYGWRYRNGRILSNFLPENGKLDTSSDSVVHACFRAAGGYSVEKMTAEGVDAIDSLPVLHFSLGAAPADAAFSASGNFKMQCFEHVKDPKPSRPIANDRKRPTPETSQGIVVSRKKPAIRASKQQSAGNFFLGLG